MKGQTAAEKLRAARARRRRQSAPADVRGCFLQRQAVMTITAQRYQTALEKLTRFLGPSRASWLDAPRVDAAICVLLEEFCFEGLDVAEGRRLLAALHHHMPEDGYGRLGTLSLPHAARAEGVRPTCAASQPCADAAGLIGADRDRSPSPRTRAERVGDGAYVRGIPAAIRAVDIAGVTRPPPGLEGAGGVDMGVPSLLIRPSYEGGEWARPAKNGEYDDSVPLDAEYLPVLATVALRWASSRDPYALLFSGTYSELKEDFNRATKDAQLPGAWNLYSLRHGGPSHNRLIGARSLEQIAKRGRWLSMRSVRRYEKAGRVQDALGRLSLEQQRKARQSVKTLGAQLLAGVVPPETSGSSCLRRTPGGWKLRPRAEAGRCAWWRPPTCVRPKLAPS